MKIKSSYIYTTIFFILGIIVGVFLCNWTYFEFEKKISIETIIEVIVTSIIGLYIAKTIQSQHTTARSEKDFFIAEIKVVKKDLDELTLFSENNAFPFSRTKTIFKELNQNIVLVNTLIQESKSCSSVDFSHLLSDIRGLRRYITSKSPDNTSTIRLSHSEKIWVESEIQKTKKDLYKLMLNINS